MAHPAKEARDQAQLIWPGAIVLSRGRRSIAHQHPTNPLRRMFDCQVANPWHIRGTNTEINTAWAFAAAPWDAEMIQADYNAFALSDFNAGQIIKYLHPGTGESLGFQPMGLFYSNNLQQEQPIAGVQSVEAEIINEDTLYWTGAYGPDIDLRWEAQPARLDKRLIIKDPSVLPDIEPFIIDGGDPVLRMMLIMQKSSNDVEIWVNGVEWDENPARPVETSGIVEFRYGPTGEVLWAFALPRSFEGYEDNYGDTIVGTFRLRKTGPFLYVEHRIPTDWLQSVTYPLEIDVTVDEQVGQSSDDAYEDSDANWSTDFTKVECGSTASIDDIHGGWRFQTVDIEGTIDVSYCILKRSATLGSTWYTKLSCDDVDDAPTFADAAGQKILNRTPTSAGVDWDPSSWDAQNQTPSMNGPYQEIVDRPGWNSGQNIVTLWLDDGTSGDNRLSAISYDGSSAQAPKGHWEYTAASAGQPTPIRTQGVPTGSGSRDRIGGFN